MAEYVTEIDPAADISAAVAQSSPEPAPVRARKCSICGEPGHTARTCPSGPISEMQQRLNRADARQTRADAAFANWNAEDIATIAGCVATILLVGTRMLETKMRVGQIRMEREEADAIAGGATRIVLRRVRVKGAMKGDVMDAITIMTALTSYIMRIGELSFHNETRRNPNEPTSRSSVQSEQRSPNGLVIDPAYFTGGAQPHG